MRRCLHQNLGISQPAGGVSIKISAFRSRQPGEKCENSDLGGFMKSVLIIGLGRFGTYMAKKFTELGNHVMVLDNDEEKINEILPYVTSAQIGDGTKAAVLESIGIGAKVNASQLNIDADPKPASKTATAIA